MTKPTTSKTQTKSTAQEAIMRGIGIAFSLDDHSDAVLKEMDKQMKRVEKLFNFEVGSWYRGV